jgi:D-tyrosyl-tRNA(Tyr) deacylase
MRAVIQRVSRASVTIEEIIKAETGPGLLVFAGIEEDDCSSDAEWLAEKIIRLRIFNDSNGIMNLSVLDSGGDVMVISQFTLHAKTRKGNRPSYIRAARPEKAIPLYEEFVKKISELTGRKTATGEFGAMMKVSLVNDGPVTIIIDTRDRE